ncbi:MAG TPA: nicotinate-nucleotide--dimethylbenzimidazole phosphoribosyltransferase [Frankiaceae bacterium]|nr:nicotinate-nucleotide--dimethylbenzimidazole phosphoribosyltransferase [Frankiaceae bacterium]
MSVPPLDERAMAAARERQASLTKPAGALGRLEALSVWLCGVQGECPPRPLARRRLVVFAGDHGVASLGVSAYPAEVTAQMVANMRAGGAACSVLARLHDVGVRVEPVSVGTPSAPISLAPAIPRAEAEAALARGAAVADEEVDAGADVLVAGDMGIGNSTVAAALVCAVTGASPSDAVGRGTGVGDEGLARKVSVVRDALARAAWGGDPVTLLAELGGADVAAMAGFVAQAARRRTPVVLDGVVPGACALVASLVEPGLARYVVAGHRSTEPSHTLALAALGLEPLLDLGLRLGEGTGALLALPLLDAAVATLREMATFGSAGVSDRA